MKNRLIVYGLIICLLIVAVFIGFNVIKENKILGKTIEEAIQKYIDYSYLVGENIILIGRGNEVVKVGEKEIVKVDEDTVIVFMLSEDKFAVFHSIVNMNWNNKWKVESMSWTPVNRNLGELHPYSYNYIISEEVNGCWGVIFDPNVETIVLRNKDVEAHATVIELIDGSRIWYKFYLDQSIEELVENINYMEAIDSDGNEVPWSK